MRTSIKIALSALCVLMSSVAVSAQDEEYYNNAWYSCELSGNQTVWRIEKFKVNISNVFPMVEVKGKLTFSDDCVEINCNNVQMHFPVKAYKRLSDNSFCIERDGEDDYFDYIEVIYGSRGFKNSYKVLMAMRDPDGTMQNTHIFICRALSKPVAKKTPMGNTVVVSKSGIFPPQVPDK